MKNIRLLALSLFTILILCSCFQKPEEGTWEFIGFEDKIPSRLVLSDSCLYACAGSDGLWKKNIGISGSEWQYLGLADSSLIDEPARGVVDVVINPENTNELLIALESARVDSPCVYRSLDNGENWEAADSGLVVYDSGYKYSQRITTLCYSSNYILGGGWGIYKTDNFGLSWTYASIPQQVGGEYCTMQRHKEIPDVVWFGGVNVFTMPILASSLDGGSNWRIYDNYGYSDMDMGYIEAIAIHPIDTNTVYVGIDDKLIKTTNGGNSWIVLFESNMYSTSIIIDTENGDHLWSCGGQVFRESFDSGITWQEIETPTFQYHFKDMICDDNTGYFYFGVVSGVYCYKP